MRVLKWFAGLFLVAVMLSPLALQACPLCSEAVSASGSGSAEEEVNEFPAAMNRSIYLMVSVPYLALGIVGFAIYRGCKKNASYLEAMQE